MDGARDPSAVEVKPAYTADGEWGWFGPNTIPGEQWANHITGEIRSILTEYGLDFDPLDDGQLAALLVALLSDTAQLREGIEAVAKIDGYDPGEAFVGAFRVYPLGAFPDRSAGCDSTVFVAGDSIFVRVGGTYLASIRADGSGRFSQLHIGGDPSVDPGSPVGEKVFFDGATGDGRVDGDLAVGGDVDAGTGAKITLAGATGDVDADGDGTFGGTVTATGGIDLGYGTESSGAVTINEVSGLTTTVLVGTWSAGAVLTQEITCDKVDADSLIFTTADAAVGSSHRPVSSGVQSQGSGVFTIWCKNEGTDIVDPVIHRRFVVINPA